jgi:hypothetical protein
MFTYRSEYGEVETPDQRAQLAREQLQWAQSIRDQIRAPWDGDAVLAFLLQYEEKEKAYHRKRCKDHWGYKPLVAPHERIP